MPTYDGLSDEALALETQGGNKDAYGELVRRFEKKISRYGKKFVADNDDINDLVQDIFIKAYININSFDAGRKFSPWLYRVAHNEFVNYLRKKKSIPFSFFEYDVLLPGLSDSTKTSDEAEREEIKRLVDTSVQDLPPKYREPLLLYYYEELDYEAIADVLEIPVATVGVRLMRGRGLLKKKLHNINN